MVNCGSSLDLSPGNKYLYELKHGMNDLLIETDQYRSIAFPLNVAEQGCIYSFLFDGNEVIQTDARPLVDVGKSASVILEFSGYPLSEQGKQTIADGLKSAMQT